MFLHFVIAFGAAAVYFLASLKLPALVRQPVRWGLAFGVGVYVFMNYVVLPLSAFKKGSGPFSLPLFVNGVLAVVLLVGLPIALLAARSMRTEGTSVR
jgi:predicted permease